MIGFDFAPLVYFNDKSGSLEVDLSMVHDVREQAYGTGKSFPPFFVSSEDVLTPVTCRIRVFLFRTGEDVKTGRVNRTSTFFKESFQASQQNT